MLKVCNDCQEEKNWFVFFFTEHELKKETETGVKSGKDRLKGDLITIFKYTIVF